ncbi:MAG TPA: alpha/beta hydrolase [Candidatus Limnocylindrales bacterium]|nr:alpha/beta hydrolase [Candidatus Limnocylindrales bacterium]
MTTSTTATTAARDGTPIHLRHWAAAIEPWAFVLLVHGLAEHSGRYEHVGGWLADAGIDTTSYDLRGFGASGGRRAWAERWDHHHDDLEERLRDVRVAAGGRPVALYGHSLGALIAAGYVLADPSRPLPDALVVSAPAIESSIPRRQRALARLLARVSPTTEMANPFDGAALSRDPSVAERYLADPLDYHRTTVRLATDAFVEQERVTAALGRLAIPTLVYHGEDDRLVPTETSRPFGDLPNVTRRTYPGLRHESHNEPEGEQVIADAVAWLRSVLEST